jgi:hypothetical protein
MALTSRNRRGRVYPRYSWQNQDQKFMGLYEKAKLDKVIHKHEQIGIKGQILPGGRNSDEGMSHLASSRPNGNQSPVNPLPA